MSAEALIKASTLKALIQAGETVTGNQFFATDASETLTFAPIASLSNPGAANDIIWDNGGNDTVNAGAGRDWMIAGKGADKYNGGSGFDVVAYVNSTVGVTATLTAQPGTVGIGDTNSQSLAFGDTFASIEGLVGSRYNDILMGLSNGQAGLFNGFDGNDTIYGGNGVDTIRGGKGNDTIFSNGGADTIFGGDGNDHIYVGNNNVVSGGAGADVFHFIMTFTPPESDDVRILPLGNRTIADWNTGGTPDLIKFEGIVATEIINYTQSGADTIITLDGIEGQIRVLNADAATDFLL